MLPTLLFSSAVEALQAEVLEVEAQLKYLREQLLDLDSQKQEHEKAISEVKRVIDVKKHSTRVEIFALKGTCFCTLCDTVGLTDTASSAELEMLEGLHMWRSMRVESTLFEFIYCDYFHVSIPCLEFKPLMNKIDIRVWEKSMLKFKDPWPQLSVYWLRVANERARSSHNLTVSEVRLAYFFLPRD
jgi:kinetochore protein Spc7/SPC105